MGFEEGLAKYSKQIADKLSLKKRDEDFYVVGEKLGYLSEEIELVDKKEKTYYDKKNYTGTTDIGNYTTDPQGLLIDYDVTGIVASGQTTIHDALAINYNQDAPTMVGTIQATGADIRMTGGTSGTQSM